MPSFKITEHFVNIYPQLYIYILFHFESNVNQHINFLKSCKNIKCHTEKILSKTLNTF